MHTCLFGPYNSSLNNVIPLLVHHYLLGFHLHELDGIYVELLQLCHLCLWKRGNYGISLFNVTLCGLIHYMEELMNRGHSLKEVVHPKTTILSCKIVFSPSSCSKPEWLAFIGGTKSKIFWDVFLHTMAINGSQILLGCQHSSKCFCVLLKVIQVWKNVSKWFVLLSELSL